MSSLVLAAPTVRHRSFAPTSLTWAAVAMVAVRPTTLWDVGFQLSVLATAGILFLAPALQTRLHRLPRLARRAAGAHPGRADRRAARADGDVRARIPDFSPCRTSYSPRCSRRSWSAASCCWRWVGWRRYWGRLLTVATDLLGGILWAHLTVLIETARLFSGVPGAALTLPPLPPHRGPARLPRTGGAGLAAAAPAGGGAARSHGEAAAGRCWRSWGAWLPGWSAGT